MMTLTDEMEQALYEQAVDLAQDFAALRSEMIEDMTDRQIADAEWERNA